MSALHLPGTCHNMLIWLGPDIYFTATCLKTVITNVCVYSVSSGRGGLVPGQRHLANALKPSLEGGFNSPGSSMTRRWASHISPRLGGGLLGSGSIALRSLIHRLVPSKELCRIANRHVHHSVKPRETFKERIVAWTCLQYSVKNLERENRGSRSRINKA